MMTNPKYFIIGATKYCLLEENGLCRIISTQTNCLEFQGDYRQKEAFIIMKQEEYTHIASLSRDRN